MKKYLVTLLEHVRWTFEVEQTTSKKQLILHVAWRPAKPKEMVSLMAAK